MAGKRELAKAERRRHILATAGECLDEEGISMRRLARKAGVSPTTLYNLFGTKHDILVALMEKDAREFSGLRARSTGGPLETVFFLIDMATQALTEREPFYKALFRSAMRLENSAVAPFYIRQRASIWETLLDEAIAAGELSPETDAALLARSITSMYSGLLQEWVLGAVSAGQMRTEVGYSVSLMLRGAAADRTAAGLERRGVRGEITGGAAARERGSPG